MYTFDISDPIVLLLLTLGTVLLIFLGKELKKSVAPAIALGGFLVLVLFHAIQLMTLSEVNYVQYHDLLLRCIAIDCLMIFVSFFSYLWIDDISCRYFKKKSIDNSLDWFWRNI